MRSKLLSIVFLFLLTSFGLRAQNASNGIDDLIAEIIAAFVENSGEEGEFDFNTLYEEFEAYKLRPINLNKANSTELRELFFLNEIQVSNLLEHRNKLGDFRSILELQTIPGFDISTIRLLKEVTTVKKQVQVSRKGILNQLGSADHTMFLKWKRIVQTQRGYESRDGNPAPFVGSPDHLYLRYKMAVGNDFKMGFIAEKDNGEPFYYPEKIYGADYFSFHVFAKDITERIKTIALGDYSISLGQGLIMHSGFGAGKSSLTTSIRKGGYAIRAYSSVAEFNFLRGGATTIKLTNNVEITSFISSKRRNSGRIILDDEPFAGNFISSLPLGGLNQTEAQIERKNLVSQQSAGTSVKYRFRKGHVAAQAVVDRLNVNLVPSEALYQNFFPSGNLFVNGSIDYGFNWRNFNFFGESAIDRDLGQAHMHGVLAGLDKTLDLVVAYRNYSKNYQSLSANAFGESPLATNESGIYMGLEYRPSKMWVISAYADQWRNRWAKFRVDGPGHGREYFLRLKYFKKRKWELYAQYFFEQKPRNLDQQIDIPVDNTRQRLRLHGSYKLTKAWTIRNRLEFSWYDIYQSSKYSGFMLYQDLVYKPIGKNYSFVGRYVIFDIDDFDARIYAYENDILNEYYIPAYNGRGSRFYINTRIRVTRSITAEARYEITQLSEPFRDEDGDLVNNRFGSGNTLIDGPVRSQVKAQIKYRF